ncbi:MAG: 2-methylcitrate dehydratase PrpD [Gammaproteobacteria bacterium]|jgi:2-methylcitrate dehydratase PrpD
MPKSNVKLFDRRYFLGASVLTLGSLTNLGLPSFVLAQQAGANDPAAKKVTQLLANFIARFDLKSAPPEAIERARIAFIDTMGVMLAGSTKEVSHLICDMVKLEGATPTASVVGQSLRTSPQLAALANGVAGHAMDYDFTFLSGQSVSPVIPAILPVAESIGATPSDCVAAFIVGCEVAARVVRASPRLSNEGQWHTTGVVGTIAAAAACAKLLKVPTDKIADVLGISVSLSSGIAANYGTMTKPLHAGNAARNGVLAAMLGARGFTSHENAFEGTAGFFNTFGRGLRLSYEPFEDLGSRYDLVTFGYRIKAYPSGGRGHTAIEAALALRDKVGAYLSDISNIHCMVSKSSATRINTEWPESVEAAKFSASYVIAYSLIHGAPGIPAFTEAALKNERVRALARLVTAAGDPELSDALGESGAKLRITLKDGQIFEQRRDYATGSQKLPMTQAQLEEKFYECASQTVSADIAKRILATLNTIHERPSFGDFWTLIQKV